LQQKKKFRRQPIWAQAGRLRHQVDGNNMTAERVPVIKIKKLL